MKTKLLAVLLFAGSTMFAGPRVFISAGFGGGYGYGYAPAPVPVYVAPPVAPVAAYVPPSPGFGYTWVGGYWSPIGSRWGWNAGRWVRPPYARSYWVSPRYYGGRYYHGYWGRR